MCPDRVRAPKDWEALLGGGVHLCVPGHLECGQSWPVVPLCSVYVLSACFFGAEGC